LDGIEHVGYSAFILKYFFSMKTSPITPFDLSASVLAVPPLSRHADLSLNVAANLALISHIEAGGVSILMYGGNANFYNIAVSEYAAVLDMLAAQAHADTWVVPSIGPDYGKATDQIAILRERAFPTAMMLPAAGIYTDSGAATHIRKQAERLGKPLIVYIKSDSYLTPATVRALDADGVVAAVKYGTPRATMAATRDDAFLKALVQQVSPSKIVSGIGERPAIVHLRDFGLQGFTSGSVCLAPRGSMAILRHTQAGRYDAAQALRVHYLPLEDLRDAINPIRTLHEAVTLAGISNMGPMLPTLSNIEPQHFDAVRSAAQTLLAWDKTH
jgi:dihydrodipicolinate synthase/N-acetylneuraminate lyase